ncbi:selenide, water dikinase SelD [Hyphomonas johnsonii]|uniref:Selenide, water dikinase n=1 Tax=Hyphomonas johnsonii MHS-2 TaxID=1280950 RepID=A0A059FCT9_9PROT|nr:selenide, water dikinase SelD [Hyphomonas johnsonii]KCZ88361.1 selenophosphate synthase [Hyphomonas johnsonii MHS-2]
MPDTQTEPLLTSLAHGGGCGCKIAPNVLADILSEMPLVAGNTNLIVDAATSDDAAVYRVNDTTALVATTDFFTPIVDDPHTFGRIAATNALSDVFAMGATPIFCLAIVGMPIGKISNDTIRAILAGGQSVAETAGAPIAGGHSIDAAEPIYGLVAMGLVHPDKLLLNSGAKAGDVLVLGKPLGVGIYSAALKRGIIEDADYAEMIASTTRLNTPGSDLAGMAGVHAATDVTGFGLLGHLSEMCRGAGLGGVIEADRVPVFAGARRLAEAGVKTGASGRNWDSVKESVRLERTLSDSELDILCDPQTSGGLLISCSPDAVDRVLAAFARHGHTDAAVVGRMESAKAGVRVV